MIISLFFISAAVFTGCQAVDANGAVDAMKACSKELGIKDDVVSKLEAVIRSKMQGGDQDAAKIQEDIKSQANQVMTASGVGNKLTDLCDCVSAKLKDN